MCRSRRNALLLSSALSGLIVVSLAGAARAGDQTYEFDIPAESLGQALTDFSKASSQQIVFSEDVTNGKNTVGLHGRYTAGAALKALLAGTDLTVDTNAAGVLMVHWKNARGASNEAGEVVIVTAEKRSEDASKIPASVYALSGSVLENTEPQSLADLSGSVPGLAIQTQGNPGQVHITLRGIADTTDTPLVGTFVGDVPIGTETSLASAAELNPGDLFPFDLDRIEVLNGPQGTLYGGSTMGGVIKYVFKDPELETYEARLGGTVEAVDHASNVGGGVRAMANIPVIDDSVAVRISLFDQKTPGWIDDVGTQQKNYNSADQYGGRLSALWKVNEALSFDFSAMYQSDHAEQSYITYAPSTLRPEFGNYTFYSFVPDPIREYLELYSLDANWNLSFAEITSTTAWQRVHSAITYDLTPIYQPSVAAIPGSTVTDSLDPYHKTIGVGKLTQEVRFTSDSDQRFEWMLAGFYTHETARENYLVNVEDPSGQPIAGLDPFVKQGGLPNTFDEYAVFTNDTYHFDYGLDLTFGARYAYNHESFGSTGYGSFSLLNQPPVMSSPANPDFTYHGTLSEGIFTWLVSPSWKIDANSMIYGRVATGYRPGGGTGNTPPLPPSYHSDTLTNYELGYKGTFDNGLNLTVAIYDIEWQNIQSLILESNQFVYPGNGKTARSRGAEVSGSYKIFDGLRIAATFSYDEAELTADAPAIGGVSGAELPYTSKISGSVSADYQREIASELTFVAGAKFRIASDYWTDVSSAQDAEKTKAARPLDLYVGVISGNVEARLFARNVTSSQVQIVSLTDPSFYSSFGTLTVWPVQPRTIGLSINYNF